MRTAPTGRPPADFDAELAMKAVRDGRDLRRDYSRMSALLPITDATYGSRESFSRDANYDSRKSQSGIRRMRACAAATASLAIADIASVGISFAIAWALSSPWSQAGLGQASGIASASATAFMASYAGVIGYLAIKGHYNHRTPFWSELQQLVVVSVFALLFNGATFAARPVSAGIPALAAWLLFPLTAMVLRHWFRRALTAAGVWQIRTVIVSHAASLPQALAALRSERWLGYVVVAHVLPENVEKLQGGERFRDLLEAHEAGLALICRESGPPLARDTMESLVRERVPFAVMPQLDGLPTRGYEETQFFSHDTVLISYRNNLAQPLSRFVKMVFDVSAAAAGLVVAAPVLLILTVLVKLDGGPAFYGHTRLGAGARPFQCLKFRSMVVDSAAVLNNLLANDPDAAAEWEQTQKLRNDPRITRIGRILRSTSLDELPQLLNVLRLEMSLVGPRPIVRAEVPHYGEDIAFYYETRPGLTGLWQVSGRTGTTYARRVQLDTWYVKNWTLWHDIAILAKTIPAVLKRRGAV